ncbi:hypothetical protein D3C72_1758630 [compost metagenome]
MLSVQLAIANGKPAVQGLVAYFGFFTVLTNIFVALVLTLPTWGSSTAAGRWFARPSVQACAATSIALVGLAYHLLLRQVWDPQGWQWVADVLLHYVMPILFCLYWLWAAPDKHSLRWWTPLAASVYPLLYLAYALARGLWLGSYPYPFIDVNALGYATVIRNALGLLFGFWLMGAVLQTLAQRVERWRRAG